MDRVRGVCMVVLIAGSLWAEPAHGEAQAAAQSGKKGIPPDPSGEEENLQKRCGACRLAGSKASAKRKAPPSPPVESGKERAEALPKEAAPPPSEKASAKAVDEEVLFAILLLLGFPTQPAPLPLFLP